MIELAEKKSPARKFFKKPFSHKSNKSPPRQSPEEGAMALGEIESTLSEGGSHIHINVNAAYPEDFELPHPSLKALRIEDCQSRSRIYPNSAELARISNEWFDVDFIIMIRTPNVDRPECFSAGSSSNLKISEYFQRRQRRFEFQYRVKLKKKPENKELCFCIELNQELKLGILQKALVSSCLLFMKKMSPSFQYNVTGSPHSDNGKYEKPHMSFAVEKVLDRLVITRPDESPPALGTELYEDLDQVKRRRSGKFHVEWNTEDTYTMAIWSHYIDWINWEVVNIPGVKHFPMSSILGDQPVFMQMYLLDKDRKDGNKHYQKDIEYVVNFEFANIFHEKEEINSYQW
jgi:hypothetical protein